MSLDLLMQHLNSVTITNARRSQFEGRDHLVAPVVILVEGVHHGSGGPLYYPASSLRASAQFWNGMPLPVYHPTVEGQPVSCNSPEITQSYSVGRLFNVVYEEQPQPRLRGEVWVDVTRAQTISPVVLDALSRNTPLEVSTGLFSVDEPVAGTWNNEEYVAVVRDIRPDHLALLPGTIGACSIADGCGVRTNKEGGQHMVDNKEQVGFFKTLAQKAHSLYQRMLGNEMSLDDRTSAVYRSIYAMDGPTADNYVQSIYEDTVVYECRPGSQSSSGATTHMYRRSYTVDASGVVVLGDDMVEVRKELNYVPIAVPTGNENPQNEETQKEDTPMVNATRVAAVSVLISNGAFTETDRVFLENMDCPQFSRIEALAARPAAPAAVVPEVPVKANETPAMSFESLLANAPADVQEQFKFNKEKFAEHRAGLVARIKANANNKLNDAQLGAMSIEVLEATAQSIAPVANYSGAFGSVTLTGNDAPVECLTLPVLNEAK